jgi:hypothetical protein
VCASSATFTSKGITRDASTKATRSMHRVCAAADCVPENLLSLVSSVLPDTRMRDRLLEVLDADAVPEAIATRLVHLAM